MKKNSDFKGVFITTYVTETWYNRIIPSASFSGTIASADMLNSTFPVAHKNFFVPGVEDMVITVQGESLNTEVEGCDNYCRKYIETTIESSEEKLTQKVKARVVPETGMSPMKWTKKDLKNGKLPQLSLKDWLALAGVNDLDDLNEGVSQGDAGNQPPFRLTGVQINVEAVYSNNKVRARSEVLLRLSLSCLTPPLGRRAARAA